MTIGIIAKSGGETEGHTENYVKMQVKIAAMSLQAKEHQYCQQPSEAGKGKDRFFSSPFNRNIALQILLDSRTMTEKISVVLSHSIFIPCYGNLRKLTQKYNNQGEQYSICMFHVSCTVKWQGVN